MKVKLTKNIALASAGLISFIFSLVFYILSYEFYQDEYGTDISFNSDYLVAMIISIALLSYGIYKIYCLKGNKEDTLAFYYFSISVTSILSFYPLGVFFKAINKKKDAMDYLSYLAIGVVCLCLLVYFAFDLISKRKQEA